MADINTKVFRAYDIRGVYPEEVNAELAFLIGKAVVKFLKEKQQKNDLKVVLSRDGRLSSPELFEAVKKGILEQGADVIDLGLVPTQVMYFAVWNYNYDGGVQITASHNPPQFNGFKLVQKNADMIAQNTGMDKIKEIVLELSNEGTRESADNKGEIIEKKVLDDYLEFNLKQFNLNDIKSFNIAVDTANGASGELIKKLSKKLPCSIEHLFEEVDGSFPNHPPDPSNPDNLKDISNFIKENKMDLGVAFDADGDRLFFLDEQGKVISASYIVSLIAKEILKDKPGEKFVYNIFMSKIVEKAIKESNGEIFMAKVGFTFLKELMKENNAIFGGEYSGHFAHREHGFIEVPIFVLLMVLKIMSETGKQVSELVAPFHKYFGADKFYNFEVGDKQAVLDLLAEKYKDGKVSYLDGVRVDFKDWWFNARPSNTENLIRLIVEANTQELADQKISELTKILKNS